MYGRSTIEVLQTENQRDFMHDQTNGPPPPEVKIDAGAVLDAQVRFLRKLAQSAAHMVHDSGPCDRNCPMESSDDLPDVPSAT